MSKRFSNLWPLGKADVAAVDAECGKNVSGDPTHQRQTIYWGMGGSSPPHPPPKKEVFLKKKLKLFLINIFFDDFKESVKVTNVQKCDFSQS